MGAFAVMKKQRLVQQLLGVVVFFLSVTVNVNAQERGKIKKAPKINQGTTKAPEPQQPTRPVQRDRSDDFEIESSNIRFQSQFEPIKMVNPVVHEDTLTLDEGELSVVEVVDSVQVGDDMVKVADYYVIWDAHSINPYGIDPLEFDENVLLKLYNPEEGRESSMPLNQIRVTSQFGVRWGRNHTGTDLNLNTGDSIATVFDGMVRVVGSDGRGYGRFVMVRHYNGLETLYGHMSKPLSESGQLVKAGEIIGLGGSTGRSTGPHLHFETRYEGNAFDPRHVFDWENKRVKSPEFELTKSVWDYRRGGRSYKSEFEAGDDTPATSKAVFHKVRSGDTLHAISRRYGTSVANLAKLNRISTRSTLRIGQRVRVR